VEGFGNTAREVSLIGWSSITRVFRVHKLIDILINDRNHQGFVDVNIFWKEIYLLI
jgi:hypothetical protein